MGKSGVRLLAIFLAVLATPATNSHDQPSARSKYLEDPRLHRLGEFFRARGCPAATLAEDFLIASDRHALDWRLLPGICFIETTGGKSLSNHNLFGWGSGKRRFMSARSGIHTVAQQLAKSKLYRGKNLASVLGTYNRHPRYAARVQAVMRLIGPADPSEIGSWAANVPYSSNVTP